MQVYKSSGIATEVLYIYIFIAILMKNLRVLERKIKFKMSDGTRLSLHDYLKTLSSKQMQTDINNLLSLISERVKVTDEKRALHDIYVICLSLSLPNDVEEIEVGKNEDGK